MLSALKLNEFPWKNCVRCTQILRKLRHRETPNKQNRSARLQLRRVLLLCANVIRFPYLIDNFTPLLRLPRSKWFSHIHATQTHTVIFLFRLSGRNYPETNWLISSFALTFSRWTCTQSEQRVKGGMWMIQIFSSSKLVEEFSFFGSLTEREEIEMGR